MKKTHLSSRLLSLLLVAAMLFSFAIPADAANSDATVSFRQVDNHTVSGSLLKGLPEEEPDGPEYADTDVVRVSILLEKASTIGAGFSTTNMADNQAAMTYRTGLQREQANMTASIEKALGEKLDVAWNLTLVANLISANVTYGQIEQLKQVRGVKDVILETRYEPQASTTDATAEPNMTISTQMTGTQIAWESGYTGAGTRIAIIDTGTDITHQSFDPQALAFALSEDADNADMEYEAFLDAMDLLDEEELEAALPKLNATARYTGLRASDLYINLKAPFGFNYIDRDLDVVHAHDTQGEHGSHVAGISTANRYLHRGNEYVSAAEQVGVVGDAPDAQVLVMKVFGKGGGAYDSDYMAAIEDAIVLGCDAVNLSLGSGNAGMTTNATYQQLLDSLEETNTVVVISAGNNSYWAEHTQTTTGNQYLDNPNYHTSGSPGTYKNALTVASVDNDGFVGPTIRVAGRGFGYTETTGYSNAPLAGLDTSSDLSGTELDYLFIDGFGKPEDYEGMDLAGKVVFCSRGETSFFEKGDVAAGLGATAVIICNNQPGTINMDLSSYSHTAPCVSITQAASAYVREHSTVASTEGGKTYYTGTLSIEAKVSANLNESAYYTMSSFSSWGVPGDLSMKPEITAPGGMIYSVNGAHKNAASGPILGGPDQYELMSGTSMAAPQIAGISALVQQYIREQKLSQASLTDRALAQSLMMSTAVPMKDADGNYYPIIQQGAGLVNTAAATSADSYVTVDGQSDGKVKAELREDAARAGVYRFSFNLNNLTGEQKVFQLHADTFTQDAYLYYANGNQSMDETTLFADTATTPLKSHVSWIADGQPVNSAGEMALYDFDGDGQVTTADAQALLDYVTGAQASIQNADHADVTGDGSVDTYDVHMFLAKLGNDTVTVPAGGSVNVTVTIALADEVKEYLDQYYTSGAYIQAYVFADAISSPEGVDGTCHSIPMLAFYGNFTDGSMFEVGSSMEYATGEEVRPPYLGEPNANSITIVYGNESGTAYPFGGNPLVPDEHYMPERNAINSKNGDMFGQWNFTAIRNAAASRLSITNTSTGEVLAHSTPGPVTAAYYHANSGTWQQAGYSLNLSWAPTALNEGDQLELALTLVPELYFHADGQIDWAALGEGASLKMPAVIDNTAPTLEAVSLNFLDNTLTVKANDNQYIAATVLYNAGGTQALAYAGASTDAKPGQSQTVSLDLSHVNGKQFLLQVADYAMNTATYELDIQLGEPQPLPNMIAFDAKTSTWIGFSKDDDRTTAREIASSKLNIQAAADVDGMIFASTDKGDLYVLDEENPALATYVTNMGVVLTDMAYQISTQTLYGVTNNTLVTVDKLLGTVETVGTIGITTNTLACDPDGNFYCIAYGESSANRGFLYKFTLDTMDVPEAITSTPCSNNYIQALEMDPNTGLLYWNSYYYWNFMGILEGSTANLYEIDPHTGTVNKLADFETEITALCIPERTTGGSWSAPTDEVVSVNLSAASVSMVRGNTTRLSATVLPWTATNRNVTWTSSDESIATVDEKGVMTAVEVGQCTITATSVLDPTVSSSCNVTVDTVQTTLEGVLQDANGTPVLFQWDLENSKTWTPGSELDTSLNAATYDSRNDQLYILDGVAGVWAMHQVSMEGKTLANSGANATQAPLWDLAYSQYLSTDEAPLVSSVYYSYFLTPKNPMALDTWGFNCANNLAKTGGTGLPAVACGGYAPHVDQNTGETVDTEMFFTLDNAGYVWLWWIYPSETAGQYGAWLNIVPSDLPELAFPGSSDGGLYCSMVAGEDGSLYLSYFDGNTNHMYRLTFNQEEAMFNSAYLGNVGDTVWPAALYRATRNTEAAQNASYLDDLAATAVEMKSEPISQEKLAETASNSGINRLAPTCQTPAKELHTDVDSGSLHAVKAGSVSKKAAAKLPVELLGVGTETDCANKTVTLTLTADDVTTNGLVTVDYDATQLTLTDTAGLTEYHSFHNADGSVTFGYAYKESVPADTALATLTFAVKEDTQATFQITTVQDCASKPGTVETVTLDVPAHDYVVTEVAATCTEQGYTLHTCKNCGASYTDQPVEALGHAWGEWAVTKAATCTEPGVETRTCSHGCGETETREIPTTEHETEIRNAREATETEDGYTGDIYCKVCGQLLQEGEVIPATGHKCPSQAFTDLDTSKWYHTYTDYVIAHGLMNGMGNGKFAPDNRLTRGQLVTTLYRLAGEPEETASVSFQDVPENCYFTKAVAWAAQNGIARGVSDTAFAPNATVTREQAATFLYRYVTLFLQQEPATGGDLSQFSDASRISPFAKEAMAWATAVNLLEGYGNGTVGPKDPVNRAQMAKFLTLLDQNF